MVVVNKKVQLEFLEDMLHARESFHLENKNMLRLKTEKTKNIRRLPSVLMFLLKNGYTRGKALKKSGTLC